MHVVRTGPLALVQDRGRPGLADVGVSGSGAADRAAYELGRRLVGNAGGAAALEVLLGGLALRALADGLVVITGADAGATVDGRAVGHAAPVRLRAGSLLELVAPVSGLRTYVSVRGGFEVPTVLGSRSRDVLSGIGPPPLSVGDALPVGFAEPGRLPSIDAVAPPRAAPKGSPVVLTVLPGPRTDWLRDPGDIVAAGWTVSSDSNRVGVRLDGPAVPRAAHHDGEELPSEGMVRGAVQLPPSGTPVLFGPDHPVTGGYPVVAVLTDAACDLSAQLRPGEPVRLRWTRRAGGR